MILMPYLQSLSMCVLPVGATSPTVLPFEGHGVPALEVAALRAASDPGLETLRAGGVELVLPIAGLERDVLVAAELQDRSLDALRAGMAPTNNEWGWIAVGAGVVLLIILL